MDPRALHWLPLAIALTAGLLILWRAALSTKERRSSGQLLIFSLYRLMRFGWAIVRGIDVGYLEYRRVLQNTVIEIENERCLGKLVRSRDASSPPVHREQEA